MARWFALAAGTMACAAMTLGAGELPKSDEDDSFEVEPPLLIPYRDPGTPLAVATPTPPVDLDRLTKEVERAKRSAISAERLFRMGALAKIEAEQRALRAVRLKADLENARLAQAKAETVAQDERNDVREVAKSDSAATAAALAQAIEAAHAATKKRDEAELQAAEVNLARQQKLLSLGSGRKSEVARAERKLAELKATRD